MATKAKKTPAKKPVAKKTTVAKSANAKSTKTTSAKVTSKTAKKEVKKAESTKKVTADAKKSVQKKILSPLEKIRSLHISTFISFIILGIVTYFLVGNTASELLLNYQARDNFTKSDNVVLGSASEVLVSVEYKYILIAILAIGAIGSLLLATKLRPRYERSVTAGVSGFRWLLIGVTSAFLLELASFMGGVQDVMTLKVIGALVLAGALFGWVSERENIASKSPRKFGYYASIFAYLAAFLPLIGSIFGTSFFGAERFGWHVYALAGVVLGGFILTIFIQKSSIQNKAKYEYAVFEQRYLRLDQTVKFLAVLIILAAIKTVS